MKAYLDNKELGGGGVENGGEKHAHYGQHEQARIYESRSSQ